MKATKVMVYALVATLAAGLSLAQILRTLTPPTPPSHAVKVPVRPAFENPDYRLVKRKTPFGLKP